MRNKAFVLGFVLTAALFAATSASATSIPFCKDYGTASLRPDPTGAGEIAVAAPRPHGGAVIKAENFGFSVTNDDNGAAIAAAVREAKCVGASKVLLAPGVYRCFGDPIVIDGLEDFELDGCGAELVFRRPLRYPIEPSWDHDGSGANFVIRNCRRMKIGNMVTDWDWRTMPLATCAKVAATHVDDADNASYIDYDLLGCGARHPYYGKIFPFQRTQPMAEDFRRFVRGPNIWHGTYEGEMGCKTLWLSPTRVRVYPFVEEPGRARWTGPNMRAFSPKLNRDSVRQHKTGETYRIAHAYYGKGGFTLVSNEDFELHDVEIPSCFGHAVYVGGTQRNWQIKNVTVAPRDWRHPISSSADTIHFVRSHGNAIIDNLTVKLEQDDAINVHDRFTVAKKVAPRTLQVVLERGARYFRPGVGNDIELLDPGYNPTGWKGKCVGTEGETILLDRDLPASNPEEGYFLVFDRTASSDGVIIRNCTFEDMEMRTLVNASNATVENCVFRRTNGDALRCIADYTLKWWAEGMGTTNVVVRNCRFEGNCVRELVGSYYSLGADFVTWLGCPENVKTERLNRRFISDILVEDCEFVDSLGYFADLRFGTGLKFRNNRIVFTGKRDRCRENSGFARVERVTDVTFEGNVFVRPEGAAEPLVEIADGVDGLALRNNRTDYEVRPHSQALTVSSPDGRLQAVFSTDDGGMRWSLLRDGKTLVKPSAMGFRFAVGNDCDKDAAELSAMRVAGVRRSSADTTWETSLYRRGKVRDRYNELVVELEEEEARAARIELGGTTFTKQPRRMDIVFRAYDEGVAFRYSFPRQAAFDGFQIKDELTEWRFDQDVMAWTTTYTDERNSQEAPFVRGPLAAVDMKRYVGMPVLVETRGATIALCEAALSNWAGLFCRAANRDGDARLVAALSKIPPSPAATADVAVIATAPAASPWRVAIVGDDALDLIRKNDIIVNLNPPPDPSIDFSFVKPGASTWDWWVESNNSLSTELTLKLVDFAAEMGWPYHTIDGGWYGFARRPNHGPNVRLEPRKGFDLERIVSHAKEKGVGIWVWIHWMEIADVGIEETFSRLEKWGVAGVKTDFLERQDQEMVNWCERVCRTAARHRIMVNFHGSFKSTGAERTWPNMITREAVLGNEMSIFRKTVTPAHCATLPFTRFLLGPADFTPGGFGNVYSKDFVPQTAKGHRYGDETDRCPHWAEEMGTRAHSIAQCIQFDSPLMTLCDWPERYRCAAGIEALRGLPAAWKDTRPVAGRCGEFYAVVRESHDGRFYFAATTVSARTVDLDLGFLGDGEWKMTVYADDPARTPSDAKALSVSGRSVRKSGRESFALCDEGGAVAVFEHVNP